MFNNDQDTKAIYCEYMMCIYDLIYIYIYNIYNI